MHLLFGGITDRIEKRHTETGAGNDAKSRGVYAAAVTAAKRTSPSRKLRQETEIGSSSVFQEMWSQIELFSCSKRGTSTTVWISTSCLVRNQDVSGEM